MKFVVGIGNPGSKYDHTRHNIGFMAVDAIKPKAGKFKWDEKKIPESAAVLLSEEAYLVKPKTFVNNTGGVIEEIVSRHQALPENILIVCDDVNLDFGKIRLRSEGNAGGHHGLESVIEVLKTQDFPRLRIGVRSPLMPKDLTDFVLGRFDGSEKKELPKILEKAASVCEVWIENGFQAAQSRLSVLQSK